MNGKESNRDLDSAGRTRIDSGGPIERSRDNGLNNDEAGSNA